MAYGNWGAFVYRNGERMRQWEDATPYRETTVQSGYWQAFFKAKDETLNPHHAVLGQQKVRLCGYKCSPILFIDGEYFDDLDFHASRQTSDGQIYQWKGEIAGCKFKAEITNIHDSANMLDLFLEEPDGTKWTSTCGFEYGSGHMDS